VAVAFLASLFSCERTGPNLESELPSQGSTLLQRNANVRTGASLTLEEEEVEHLPLCDPLIVDESCQQVNGIAEGASPSSVTWALLADVLSTSSLEEAREAMALPSDAAVGCMELCKAAVRYVRSSGGVLPPSSNVACRTVHGNTTCDVEADPGVLARKFGSIADMELPDHGPLTAVTDETDAGSESGGRAFLYQEVAGHTSRGALSALLQRGRGDAGNATPSGEVLAYSVWEAVERIANLFCVYPSTGKDVDVFEPSEPVLLQAGTTSADATVAYRASEARAWLATILRNVNGNQEAAAQRQWFGGAGNMNAEQVRQYILRTFNFINREFAQGFYFVIPADNAKSSVCNQGAVAYVWKYQVGTGYRETTGPRCSSRDNPRTKNCALDEYGKYYVYLCNAFLSSPQDYQVGVLIHEAAHHAGPTDITYDQNQMQRESQSRQLENAANYQYFAQTVAEGGCSDTDGNCRYYTSYCDQQNIKDVCKQTCGLCNSGGGGGGGGGGTCSDEDGNCRFYTSYCNTDNIKAVCKKTCGLCGSGGSGGCADTYGSCQWYRDNNYCGTANVLAQCKRTCGACR